MADPRRAPAPRELSAPRGLPPALASLYLALPPDAETASFRVAHARPHGRAATLLHAALRRWVSDYDADGWLGMHPLHLLGTASWKLLLGAERVGGALLDVGAGRGDVTACLAPLFDRVVATETSRPMVRRLRARGFEAHALDLSAAPWPDEERFSAVALLAVLDRCARPRTLLRRAIERLAPGGAVVVSLPLPARPHVDAGSHTVDPDEPLPVRGDGFEEALGSLATDLLAPAGLEVERWTRTPYLAQGDAAHPMHALDTAILVCRTAGEGTAPPAAA